MQVGSGEGVDLEREPLLRWAVLRPRVASAVQMCARQRLQGALLGSRAAPLCLSLCVPMVRCPQCARLPLRRCCNLSCRSSFPAPTSLPPPLSLSLSHPNVLTAYKMCVVRLQRDGELTPDARGAGGGDAPKPGAAAAGGPAPCAERVSPRSIDLGPATGSGADAHARDASPQESGSPADGGAAPARGAAWCPR